MFGIDRCGAMWAVGALDEPDHYRNLLVLYAVNTAAFTIEFASYSRRMRQLFDRNQAGIAYGKRIEAQGVRRRRSWAR